MWDEITYSFFNFNGVAMLRLNLNHVIQTSPRNVALRMTIKGFNWYILYRVKFMTKEPECWIYWSERLHCTTMLHDVFGGITVKDTTSREIDTLSSRQNGHHFTDILQCISLNGNVLIIIAIWLNLFPRIISTINHSCVNDDLEPDKRHVNTRAIYGSVYLCNDGLIPRYMHHATSVI